MRKTRWVGAGGATDRAWRPARIAALVLLVAAIASTTAPRARANVGYALDSAHPSKAAPGPLRGLTVDPENGDIYVAIVSMSPSTGGAGEIARFNHDLSADGTFAAGGGFYSGIALDPVSNGFFAAQMEIPTSLGNFGTPRLDRFSSTGSSAGSFALAFTDSLPQIATDSAGRIYYPNVNTHSVQVLASDGTLLEDITCSGCPGGSFGKPASVALDAAGDLYVADASPDRVVELTLSGGHYVYSSLVQSGRGAGAVAVDPASGDVLVGDMPGGKDYHVVAYDTSGTQFDDFGAGMAPDSTTEYGSLAAYQLAVNGSTHELYVGSDEEFYVFEKTTIPPPGASAEPATNVAQLGATLNASVNANGHAVLECEFEYTSEADFQANGFSGASTSPCSANPDGTASVQLSASISGLSPSSKYRFRVTATSNGGSTSSGNQGFETLPELSPLVTTEAAQDVTQSGAKIMAKVNPRGGTVSDCHFELGTSVSYGTSLSCLSPASGATSDVSEARVLTSLSPGTTYHYRLVVSTNAGTADGGDVEFTTISLPVEPEPEPAPTTEPAPAPATSPPPAPLLTGPLVAPHAARCKKGFRRERIHGHARCVKVCRKGFRRERIRGKVRCVRRGHSHRRRHRRHRRGAHRRSK